MSIEWYSDTLNLKADAATIYKLKENEAGSYCVVSVNDGKFIYSWDSETYNVKKAPVGN